MSGSDDPFAALAPVAADEPGVDARVGDDVPALPDDEMRALLERAARLPLNDYGNGQRFGVHFGRDCIWVPRVGWFVWDGRVWAADGDELVVRRHAHRLSDLIEREIPYLVLSDAKREILAGRDEAEQRRIALERVKPSDRSEDQAAELAEVRQRLAAIAEIDKSLRDRRSRHRSFATTTGNSTRLKNALDEAKVDLARPFDALDAEPLAINCESGLIRFSVVDSSDDGGGRMAEMVLSPHAREHLQTKMMPVQYDPAAPCERFDAFLERVQPDREMREFLKRWMGLSMTGLPMQRLAFFYGGGANGKSVLVDLMARIMGNYAATARIESLTGTNRRGGSEATPDLIPLMGARFVRTSEPDEGQRLQEGLIKELTGGEPILMRQLQEAFLEVRPVFKLTMSGNHKPDIRGTDDGIWRRVLLVPFDVQIPEAERDPDLVVKLYEERAGIFNWLLEGLTDYLEGGLSPPDAVVQATQEYREESDPIGVFLGTCCVVTGEPSDTILSKVLGDAFAFHMIERGMSPWKPATFARQISAKSRHWRHPQTGRQFAKGKASLSQYVGLRLTDSFQRRFDHAPKDQQGRPIGVPVEQGQDAPHPDSGF